MAFIRKVYSLFTAAMLVWAGTTALVMSNESLIMLFAPLFGGGFLVWIGIMAVLFLILRMTAASFPLNLVGLGVFAILEGLITAPFIVMVTGSFAVSPTGALALNISSETVAITGQAFALTAAIFGSLTAYVLTTKKDFSFMRGALFLGFGLMFGLMVLSFFWGGAAGIVGGTGFAVAMVLLFAGFMLYDTSNIVHRYPANMAAAAAASLLIDFVAMFRWILILMSNRD